MKRKPIEIPLNGEYVENGWSSILLEPIRNIGGFSFTGRKNYNNIPPLRILYKAFMMGYNNPPDTSFIDEIYTYPQNVVELASTFVNVTGNGKNEIIERPDSIEFSLVPGYGNIKCELKGGVSYVAGKDCALLPTFNDGPVFEYDEITGFPAKVAKNPEEMEKAFKTFGQYTSYYFNDSCESGIRAVFRSNRFGGPYTIFCIRLTRDLLSHNKNVGVRKFKFVS